MSINRSKPIGIDTFAVLQQFAAARNHFQVGICALLVISDCPAPKKKTASHENVVEVSSVVVFGLCCVSRISDYDAEKANAVVLESSSTTPQPG